MANDPGWYPDPWRPGQRRWWDGKGWTDHTWDPSAPPAAAPAPFVVHPDPRRDLNDERNAAQWAKRGFVAYFVGRTVGGLISIVVVNDFLDNVQKAIDTNGRAQPDNGGFSAFNLPFSILSILGLVAILLWAFKAATVARNLRYPAQRGTVWAVIGWFVPVVNFWFPYQVVRDCLAPGNPERRTVLLWWTLYLVGIGLSFAAIITSLVSSLAIAFTLALPAIVVGAIEVSLALRVVDAVEADHGTAINRVLSGGQ